MEVPKIFFQNTKFVDPLVSAISKTNACIDKKRGLKQQTLYNEIKRYAKQEVDNFGKLVLGEEWILNRIFTTKEHKNSYMSNMIGVYHQHDKTILFIFAREISEIIHLQGFKNEILDYILSKIISSLPKMLSNKYKVQRKEDNFIIKKK